MDKKQMRKVYELVKEYKTIFITRHIGADPDALGAQIGLKEVIMNSFSDKTVYAIGHYAAKFKYMGKLDRGDSIDREIFKDSLLIVLDTPNLSRIDNAIVSEYKYTIKIDHHPFIEKFANLEIIDDKASSTCQMLLDIVNNTKFELNKESAENLFLGIVADTNRFMYQSTSPETLRLAADVIENNQVDYTKLYSRLYSRSVTELKFQSYIGLNLDLTQNGLAYIIIDDKKMKEMGVDSATAGNLISYFNHINEFEVWVTMSEDINQGIYKVSIRSRGPIINKVAEKYGGGGHIYASGIRLKDKTQLDNIIKDLDQVCREYNLQK